MAKEIFTVEYNDGTTKRRDKLPAQELLKNAVRGKYPAIIRVYNSKKEPCCVRSLGELEQEDGSMLKIVGIVNCSGIEEDCWGAIYTYEEEEEMLCM